MVVDTSNDAVIVQNENEERYMLHGYLSTTSYVISLGEVGKTYLLQEKQIWEKCSP